MRIYDLKTEYLKAPNAVDAVQPRFSWKIASESKGVRQKSYHIVAKSEAETLWDSGTVESDECRFIRYEGKPLQSRQKVVWQVFVTAEDAEKNLLTAGWETSFFRMGLLHKADWRAKWITVGEDAPGRRKAAYVRRQFTVRAGLIEARLYQTAHGLYESFLNGHATDNDKFKPGLTSYYYRIQYQTYDVADLLNTGENVWKVILADGWWRGSTGGSIINNFGHTLDFLGQLELVYTDGTTEIIGTDEKFETSDGPLLAADMLMGDIYDARLRAENWHPVRLTECTSIVSGTMAQLIASRSVPVRENERFEGKPFHDASGALILDFGQNIAGNVLMVLRNTRPGQLVRLTHGETLDHDGNFTIDNVNKCSLPIEAFQEVTYICKGAPEEVYQPSFSIFGFRYVKVEGYENDIQAGDFTAVAIYSFMEETGDFRCSNPLITKLEENARWSDKRNYLDVPVDSPTRERNAWTGDAQIFVRTACTFMNGYAFYEKWLKDQTLEQFESGKVGITFPSTSSAHNPAALDERLLSINPFYSLAGPTGNGNIGEDATGWGDSAVWLPYSVYLWYGDVQILKNQYETARRWVEFELACARNENPLYADQQYVLDGAGQYVLDTCFQYGEWNEAFGVREKVKAYYEHLHDPVPEMSPEQIAAEKKAFAQQVQRFLLSKQKTGDAITATAYMARSLRLVANMARILGKVEDAETYAALAEKITGIYARYFIAEDGTIQEGHQAPYVRALAMELCGEKKEKVLEKLLSEIEANGYALNTGFLSTPFLLPVLAENGHSTEAYRILENEELPGWLYPVKKGMTTIPESWGGVDLLNDSLNHYSYGSVCEFLFQYTAGIRPDPENPGWKHFFLKPVPGGSLTYAEARQETPFGEIRSIWKLDEEGFHYVCSVPANTVATLTLPNGETRMLGSGTYIF